MWITLYGSARGVPEKIRGVPARWGAKHAGFAYLDSSCILIPSRCTPHRRNRRNEMNKMNDGIIGIVAVAVLSVLFFMEIYRWIA